nr:EOG090X0MWD [Eulimnadia texana]
MPMEQSILKLETYINNVLKSKLKNVLDERDRVCSDIAEYVQLKTVINSLEEAELSNQTLKSKVDLGCNFYVQAEVENCSKIFVSVGFGFFVELTLAEAVEFIDKKVALLEEKLKQLSNESAEIKADINVFLDQLAQLQNITPPRHMSSSIDEFRFNLPYEELFGGAVALTSEQFAKANGYSNVFYGWGGEDDDFFNRVTWAGYKILRFEPSVSMYKMLSHAKEKPNPDRFQKLREGHLRFETDGLTNLEYRVVQFELRPLYTWILVDV